MNPNEVPRLLPPRALLFSMLLQAPFAVAMWPPRPTPMELLLGGAMAAAGIALNLDASARFKASKVGICPFSPAPRLVETGSYRFTRNPMYLGLVLVSASLVVGSGILGNVFCPILYAGWLHFEFILPEEAFLLKHHGEDYRRYAECRPRWFGLAPFLLECRSGSLPQA